eukprot:Skav222787  [mRNA]  locus=scaffold1254:87387:87971:+ [translate_table: standard]
MRHEQLLHHGVAAVSSLLDKQYSEANFTQELLKMFAQRANLTETLGVSAKAADLMQASYEAVMEDNLYELGSNEFIIIGGSIALSIVIWVLVYICACWCLCLTSCSGLLQTGEQVDGQTEQWQAKQIKQQAVYEKKTAFALWLYKKKFGNDQAAVMETCISQVTDKGTGLLRKAGLDETLLDQLHGTKEAKPRT